MKKHFKKITNRDIYNKEELKHWAYVEGLILAEKYIINKYLNKYAGKRDNIKILDAGTGNGRLLFELYGRGFKNLYGFDIAKNLLRVAIEKQKKIGTKIQFSLKDASKLNYPSIFFDYVFYIQQIICFIEEKNQRLEALKEAYRILKPKGLMFSSFLEFRGRFYNYPLAIFIFFMRAIRKEEDIWERSRLLPWLKREGHFNLHFWKKNEPLNYWYTKNEILTLFSNCEFEIKEVFTSKMLTKKQFNVYSPGGMLYVITQKKE